MYYHHVFRYGGYNLLNMHYILGEANVADSLTWNPIDEHIICPIHEHFKVPPCMFRPSPTMLNIRIISMSKNSASILFVDLIKLIMFCYFKDNQVNKFKAQKEAKDQMDKENLIKKKLIKKEKKKAKLKKKREEKLNIISPEH